LIRFFHLLGAVCPGKVFCFMEQALTQFKSYFLTKTLTLFVKLVEFGCFQIKWVTITKGGQNL
jgi:hypothetical protein